MAQVELVQSYFYRSGAKPNLSITISLFVLDDAMSSHTEKIILDANSSVEYSDESIHPVTESFDGYSNI